LQLDFYPGVVVSGLVQSAWRADVNRAPVVELLLASVLKAADVLNGDELAATDMHSVVCFAYVLPGALGQIILSSSLIDF